jgi:hypothetical protein
MDIQLIRFAYHRTCTLGYLNVEDLQIATLERPWIPNLSGPGGSQRISCVPDGRYRLIQHSSDRFPNVWALLNPELGVWYQPYEIPKGQGWGRSAILIHGGNRVTDVVGCIAVGLKHSITESEHVLGSSQIALGDLRGKLRTGEHTITIETMQGAK